MSAPRLAVGLAHLLTLIVLALYAVVALGRMGFPYDLEWMEGATLEHVARVLEHRPIYAAPSVEFVAYLYTPLYYLVCAPVAAVLGLGLPALRLVSFAASLGTFAALYRLVRAQTADRAAAVIAVGAFASTFLASGAWLDLARVDSLFLCLAAWGLVLAARGPERDLPAAALFAAAFFTKQTAIVLAAGVALHRLVAARGIARVRFALVTGAVIALVLVLADRASDGWLRFYVFAIPGSHPIDRAHLVTFFTHDLLRGLPLGLLALPVVLVSRAPGSAFHAAAALAFVGGAYLARINIGAAENVLLPAFFALAWSVGRACAALRTRGHLALPALLVCAQLALGLYDPRPRLPDPAARTRWDEVVAVLRRSDGDVLVPSHAHLARLAGKRTFAHAMAVEDVLRSGRPDVIARYQASRERRYGAILVDEGADFAAAWYEPRLGERYVAQPLVLGGPAATMTMRTGWRIHPGRLYAPR